MLRTDYMGGALADFGGLQLHAVLVASNADSYSDDLHKVHKHCSKSSLDLPELNPMHW